ncbi:MAG: hypothetical protein IPG56_12770 [Caulobacteraceae bacterium]|nr:hypothetical protein [Caulobacteraceae bacterium]
MIDFIALVCVLRIRACGRTEQFQRGDLPALSADVSEAIDSVVALHGVVIGSTARGRALMDSAQTYALSDFDIAVLRGAAQKLSDVVTASPEVFDPTVRDTRRDLNSDIGEDRITAVTKSAPNSQSKSPNRSWKRDWLTCTQQRDSSRRQRERSDCSCERRRYFVYKQCMGFLLGEPEYDPALRCGRGPRHELDAFAVQRYRSSS